MVPTWRRRLFRGRKVSQECTVSVPSQVAESATPNTQSEAHAGVDGLISNAKGAITATKSALDGFPVPGLSAALSISDQLLDRIHEMRGNLTERTAIAQRIGSLVNMLKSMVDNGNSSVDNAEYDVIYKTMGSAQVDAHVTEAISKLEEALEISKGNVQTGFCLRLWYSKQDAEALANVRTTIENAIKDLDVQGGLVVQKLLSQIMEDIRAELLDREREVLEKLKKADDASYRSRYVEEKAKLQEGTRERILREVMIWAKDMAQTRRVQVIYGPAGAGKSSIARAICEALAEDGHIGASFFFRRGDPQCSDPYLVIPTIAYQLAHSTPDLTPRILSAVKEYTQHGQAQGIAHQGRVLFNDILQGASVRRTPLVLVFDGVDECSRASEAAVQSLLQLLCQAGDNIPYLRIFIATRPEPYIMCALPAQTEDGAILRNLWTDAADEIDGDIQLFIQSEFDRRARRGNFILLQEHPDAVERLTSLSAGLFVYANVALRALLGDDYGAVGIFNGLTSAKPVTDTAGIQTNLGRLYLTIVNYAFNQFNEDVERMRSIHRVLTWIAIGQDVFHASQLELVGIPCWITQDVIHRLRSVIIVDGDVTASTPLRACHASFPQFLIDPTRRTGPTTFSVDPRSGHAMIAASLLDLLAHDVVSSQHSAIRGMSQMWDYARWHWNDHLLGARYAPDLGRALRGFAETHLYDWVRNRHMWISAHNSIAPVDGCAEVRNWYEENGPDVGLVVTLDNIIDQRVKELIAEAAQSPDEFTYWHLDRIKAWSVACGYTPEEELEEVVVDA